RSAGLAPLAPGQVELRVQSGRHRFAREGVEVVVAQVRCQPPHHLCRGGVGAGITAGAVAGAAGGQQQAGRRRRPPPPPDQGRRSSSAASLAARRSAAPCDQSLPNSAGSQEPYTGFGSTHQRSPTQSAYGAIAWRRPSLVLLAMSTKSPTWSPNCISTR